MRMVGRVAYQGLRGCAPGLEKTVCDVRAYCRHRWRGSRGAMAYWGWAVEQEVGVAPASTHTS